MSVVIVIAVLLATFVVADRLTVLMIRLAPRLGLMDQLGEQRRIHRVATPRAGGIAVFAALLAGIGLMFWTGLPVGQDSSLLEGHWIIHFLIGAGLLMAVGVIDDRMDISAWWKLAGQVAAAGVMFLSDFDGVGRMYGYEIPWWIDLGVHVAWVVLLVNAFNLIDGMDGLCAGLGLISLSILAVLALSNGMPVDAVFIGVMMLALAGFLRHNLHPAKIFLGDAGSMLIGFFVATAGQASVGRNAVLAGLLLPLLVAGIPLFDVFLAIWRRGVRRFLISKPGDATVRIFGADREHLHHRIMGWGMGQRGAAMVIYALASLIAVLALIPMLGGQNLIAFSVVGILLVVLVGLRYIAPLEIIESAEGLRALVRRPMRRQAVMLAYVLYDAAVLLGSAWFSIWLVEKVAQNPLPGDQAWMVASLIAGCSLLALRFAGAHSRCWTRAGTSDFAMVLLWLICGVILSGGLVTLFLRDIEYRNAAIHVLAFGLSATALCIPRCLGLSVQAGALNAVHWRCRLRGGAGRPALIYGAGDLGELFLSNLRLSAPGVWADYSFLGVLDDQEQLKGRRLLGLPIFGSLSGIESIVERLGIQSVIVTMSRCDPDRHAELLRLAEELKLEVRAWVPDLSTRLVREEESLPPSRPSTPAGRRPEADADGAAGSPEVGSRVPT